jgi:FdhE protein
LIYCRTVGPLNSFRSNQMPYVPVTPATPAELAGAAAARWAAIVEKRPELEGAVALQRKLLDRVTVLWQSLERARLPRLSMPAKYIAAKLGRGVPALAGEPIPLPIASLTGALLGLCGDLAEGGAGDAAEHIQACIQEGRMDPRSLLSASLSRNQDAIRTGATHRGLAADLVWLAAELAVGPFAYILQRTLLADAAAAQHQSAEPGPVASALDAWTQGYCPACGSWPALAEVVDGHRLMRCSFCAAAWELTSYACVYCGEAGPPFVTAAPDEERKDRRVEVCTSCHGYLKTVDTHELSPFPLLAIADLETMDLDMAAMEHGYQRPALKEMATRR